MDNYTRIALKDHFLYLQHKEFNSVGYTKEKILKGHFGNAIPRFNPTYFFVKMHYAEEDWCITQDGETYINPRYLAPITEINGATHYKPTNLQDTEYCPIVLPKRSSSSSRIEQFNWSNSYSCNVEGLYQNYNGTFYEITSFHIGMCDLYIEGTSDNTTDWDKYYQWELQDDVQYPDYTSRDIFQDDEYFDSQYAGSSADTDGVKIINQYEPIIDGYIWTAYIPDNMQGMWTETMDLYYKDKDDHYQSLSQQSITFVTFIPYRETHTDNIHDTKWVLCQFVRGVTKNNKRLQYEWQPLLVPNSYDFDEGTDKCNVYVLSDDEYREFLKEQELNGILQEYFQYNINEDDLGRLYDYRNADAVTVEELESEKQPFVIPGRNDQANLITTQKYYYNWEENNGLLSNYSYILMDKNGMPLCCPELIKRFGIGFILSDWVQYEENEGCYVIFKPIYLKQWLNHNDNGFNITDWNESVKGYIYPLQQLQYNTTTLLRTEYKDIDNNLKITNEKFFYEYLEENFFINVGDGQFYPYYYGGTQSDINNTITTRRNFDVDLKTWNYYGEPGDITNYGYEVVYPKKTTEEGGTVIEYVTFVHSKYDELTNTGLRSLIIRFKIFEDSSNFNILTDNYRYKDMCFWEQDETGDYALKYIIGNNFVPNNYDGTGAWKSDIINSEYILDENGKRVYRYVLYRETYNIQEDITRQDLDTIPYNSEYSWFRNFIQLQRVGKSSNTLFKIDFVQRTPEKSAEEYLEEALASSRKSYMTPFEYYSNNTANFDADTVEDLNSIQGESVQDWFWLDTISNWCKYMVAKDGVTLLLYCWNGQNGWDDILTIMDARMRQDYNTLYKKYLYNKEFFDFGTMMPHPIPYQTYNGKYMFGVQRSLFNPIIYANNDSQPGQIRYQTLVLTKDTVSFTYSDIMQNLHDSKIYYCKERNEYANVGRARPKLDSGVAVDIENPAAFGMPTQYCPCLVKLGNGNYGIMYDFVAQTNGAFVLNTGSMTCNMISQSEANNRCRYIFGSGDDKTIDDWKRLYKFNITEEQTTDIETFENNTLFDAVELTNNVNDVINTITLNANRINVTTDKNSGMDDYVLRWDK